MRYIAKFKQLIYFHFRERKLAHKSAPFTTSSSFIAMFAVFRAMNNLTDKKFCQCLDFLLLACFNKEISDQSGMSQPTISHHFSSVPCAITQHVPEHESAFLLHSLPAYRMTMPHHASVKQRHK